MQRTDPLRTLVRLGFYFSVALFVYGTLFPSQFDFSPPSLSKAWPTAGFLPFWDAAHGRIHSLTDMAGNVLLTIPIGFFGFVRPGKQPALRRVAKWGVAGLALGLAAETIRLAIPARFSDITDAINNGVGRLAGAWAGHLLGQ
jgi:glycopeptide antibiotics resistance protein